MVCGTGRILMGMTLQVHKRKVVPKPHRSQNSIHCGKDAVTLSIDNYNSVLTKFQLFIFSLWGGAGSLHIFWMIFANYCIYRKIHVSLIHLLVIIDTLSERLTYHTRLSGIYGPKSSMTIPEWGSNFWLQIYKRSVGPFYSYMFTEYIPCSLVRKNCLDFPSHSSHLEVLALLWQKGK